MNICKGIISQIHYFLLGKAALNMAGIIPSKTIKRVTRSKKHNDANYVMSEKFEIS